MRPGGAQAHAGMGIAMVTGGARSGKSRYAVARAAELGGERVSYVATAEAVDGEMERRIRKHREERPSGWETLVAPERPDRALRDARHPVVVLDCLTLHLAAATREAEGEEDLERQARRAVSRLLEAAAAREGRLLVVTNELGLGTVPSDPVARWFRDAQGKANHRLAEAAEAVVFMVSGLPWTLKGPGGGPQ